ncbi:S1C family serine protease [Akkermansiaceae bacterium]|nr:S1C family serine protease [Akkermansiaceae bacterium]MDB4287775.1 S1C family serine protease [bacterium]MDB4040997.1 S1C family serine protease [Akkermansiaceae bacterium]MDB4258930.1 S1C family serine protease [Akkermansiaceae bacterium]MDB4313594.1 S1C family serine protease [Akkermansiaceae bacterium]
MKFQLLIASLLSAQLSLTAPAIESLGDLRRIQKKIQVVVAEATPATISLLSPQQGASGSGVIVSPEGLILTAAHVVAGSREVVVIFPDGREERAKVLGQNHTRDAAMAQLIGEGPWPFVEVGASDPLVTGDLVVAMGHPKGYDPTRRPPVRFGRVMTKDHTDFITTDCTVIGGDSGGPLFDLDGKVVGIHSHINIKSTEINKHAGLSGFKKSWDKMLKGEIWGILGGAGNGMDRPVIGIVLDERSGNLKVLGLPPGSPAKEAGVRRGDILVKADETALVTFDDLRLFLIDHQPGDEMKITVQRGEELLELNLTLAGLRGL